MQNLGLTPVSVHPIRTVLDALERSIATFADCERAYDAARAALGDDAVEWTEDKLRALYRRDPDDPEWVVAFPVAVFAREASMMRQGAAPQLTFAEGKSQLTFSCGPDGGLVERSLSVGDGGPMPEDRPFSVDSSRALRSQPPPISMVCRPEWDPAGHSPEQIGAWVADLRPWEQVPARTRLPIVRRPEQLVVDASQGIRAAAWSGTFGAPSESWAVADGLNGEVIALASDRAGALLRWQDMVERGRLDEKGRLTAVAFRVGPRPAVPKALAALGFDQAVLLLGDDLRTAWAFLRRSAGGAFVLVGEGAVPAVGADLDAVLDGLEAEKRKSAAEMFPGFPKKHENPWWTASFVALDKDGRPSAQLRAGGFGNPDRPVVNTADTARFEIHRVRPA